MGTAENLQGSLDVTKQHDGYILPKTHWTGCQYIPDSISQCPASPPFSENAQLSS